MPGRTYLPHHVLELIHKSQDAVTANEIAQKLEIPYSTVARILRKLSKERMIRRIAGPGHSYKYRFVSFTAQPVGRKGLPIPSHDVDNYTPLNADQLRKITAQWVESGWKPKSTKAAQELLDVLSQLYQFMWLEVVRGQPVDQSDIDFCKAKLVSAKRLADTFSEFFGRMLATDALWDSKKVTAYTLAEIDDPQEFLERARRVNQALQ